MATINAINNSCLSGITVSGGTVSIVSGTSALGISTDASATTVSIATGGAVKGVTVGSTNSTSATTVQSGSGALNVTATNGALTINSGTGALAISNDASATTLTIGTGAAAKTVTLGSTNTTSSTAIKSGSGNVAINSGLTVSSGGVVTNTVQPAFSAYVTGNVSNVTGDSTVYTVIFGTAVHDNTSALNTGTGVFTVPVTGFYIMTTELYLFGFTTQTSSTIYIYNNTTTTAITTQVTQNTGTQNSNSKSSGVFYLTATHQIIVQIQVSGGAKAIGVAGPNGCYFTAALIC